MNCRCKLFDDGYTESSSKITNTKTQEEFYYVHGFPKKYPYNKKRSLTGRDKRWVKLLKRINANKIIGVILGHPQGRKIIFTFNEEIPTFLRNLRKEIKK